MRIRNILAIAMPILVGVCGTDSVLGADADAQPNAIVQYGNMHEAIGQQQHQGRVRFSDLTKRPHFFGVAALAGLRGEATIYDGQLTVSTVDKAGSLHADEATPAEAQATMLAGAYVASWSKHKVMKQVPAASLDDYLATLAAQAGLNLDQPFVFRIEGPFLDVDLHVINGACPIHARMKKIELPKQLQPFEAKLPEVDGKVVGIFAKDSVGKLTHPATSTHMHLLYRDPDGGDMVTGHIESIGLQEGSVLFLPAR